MKQKKNVLRISVTLAMTAVLCHCGLILNAAGNVVKGDADNSGYISSFDLISYKKNKIYSKIPENMDLNYTGTLTKTDMGYIKGYLVAGFAFSDRKSLVINEVCTSNENIVTDGHGDYSDWIELYNGTSAKIDLSDYGLSDNPDNPYKWVMPSGTFIDAGQYLIVYASDSEPVNGELHTNYGMSKDGETLTLTQPGGVIEDTVSWGAMSDDIAYGRYPNGSDIWKAVSPTVGKSNDGGSVVNNYAAVQQPSFSHEGGFYDEPINVSVDSDSGLSVYYTTDGSDPTVSSDLYTASLTVQNRSNESNVYSAITGIATSNEYIPNMPVEKSTVLRAATYEPEDGNYSEPITGSYFVGVDHAQKYPGAAVISITTDPSNLFDYEKGIFVKGKVFDDWVKGGGNPNGDEPWTFPGNFTQRGREWEREVNMEFFEPDGTLGFSQKLGMRISGNATRTYNKKSLRFYARGEYGKKNVNYDLLPGLTSMSDRSTPVTKFDTFILRTGGNDSDYSKIRDIYNQELVKDRSFDTQGYRPAVVFIDGEYWGVYSVMQDFNDKYIENHYGVPAEEVITVTNWYEVDDGENDDANLYRSLINFARNNDLSVQSNYDMISTMMDVKNYIEYYIAEIYIANDDWPQNNVKVWRARNVDSSNPYMDGKWRWMMHDTDISMNLYDRPETSQTADTLSVALNYNGDSAVLFSALMKNDGFRTEFKETVNDMKNKEFNPSNALSVLDEIVTKYKPMIRDDMYRNGPSWVVQWTNPPEKHFYDEVDKIKAFVSSRASYLDTMIANNLD